MGYNDMPEIECAIIGGGPAGLSAALVLGRARRRTILFDGGRPRNRVTKHSHGYLTRDGITPSEFRAIAHAELSRYPTLTLRQDLVTTIRRENDLFYLATSSGFGCISRKVVLATGLRESLPAVPDAASFYGTSLFSCPYCDGYEMRDRPLAILSDDPYKAAHMAQTLCQWSRDLLVCTNGHSLGDDLRRFLELNRIAYAESRIAKLIGSQGQLRAIRFEDGRESIRTGGIVITEWEQAGSLHLELGCKLTESGGIETDGARRTSVEGVFAAGDAAVIAPAQLIIAAADGSRAAIGVNSDLTHESFHPPIPHLTNP